ncbi:quercetin dioxygenase-like cupin family protein [Deinococcus metalli]|uniref:Quercetin dioxygenase-like cupin family protein n=1 Tax=Deinococcus metalli TaxID=1141878 RepID=A0A7W8KHY7_9DEIO|nr:cupin domain-containing protein [Deinococcus metalli]MBB5377356.1 quercetin dioxygenase-like cupin family protein [Deinococcus metalli]
MTRSEQPVEQLAGRTLQWLAHADSGAQATALLENVIEPGGFIPLHVHAVEELLVCVEGSGHVQLGGAVLPFRSGDTAIVPAGAVHGVVNPGPSPLRMLGFFPEARPVAEWV